MAQELVDRERKHKLLESLDKMKQALPKFSSVMQVYVKTHSSASKVREVADLSGKIRGGPALKKEIQPPMTWRGLVAPLHIVEKHLLECYEDCQQKNLQQSFFAPEIPLFLPLTGEEGQDM